MKILSVDDSRAVHAYLTECLKASPVTVTHAYGGSEGLALFSGQPFDLVLLDWEMPDVTGPEVLKEIRKTNQATPVIMLTSKNAPDDISAMLALGANEYVMKPFTPDILLAKIEEVTGKPMVPNGSN